MDQFALSSMAEAFRDKVLDVCSAPAVLAAPSLPHVLDLDLQALFVRDGATQQAQLNITDRVSDGLRVNLLWPSYAI